MTADTSEKGLESLIVRAMTGRVDLLSPPHVATETSAPVAGGTLEGAAHCLVGLYVGRVRDDADIGIVHRVPALKSLVERGVRGHDCTQTGRAATRVSRP